MEIDSDSSPSPTNPQSASQLPDPPTSASISPSQRITELNQIDTSISTLLSSASTATSILANTSSSSTSTSLSNAQKSFTAAASTYFSTLSSIEVRLRRQVYALEEAGLIQPGDERDTRRGRTLNDEDGASAMRRGGGGPLDPSWLNARSSESVEINKKRELLAKAKEVLKELGVQDVEMEGTEGSG